MQRLFPRTLSRISFAGWLALSAVIATGAWAMTPVEPTTAQVEVARAMSELDQPRAATAPTLSVDTSSRENVRQFFRTIYGASVNPAMNWTGSYTTGAAGDTAQAFKDATLLRINFYRAMVGVPAGVVLNSTFSAKNQQAALMMSASGMLDHHPETNPSRWTFYTADAAQAANNSNLAIGSAGSDAIDGYVSDPGSTNDAVGHRRWLFYPQTREMGTGDVPGDSTHYPANTVWIIDQYNGAARPTTRTTQVTYPAAGYTPYQLVWPRWSFSYPNASFTNATVTMTKNGQSVPVTLEPPISGAGEATLAWIYNNLDQENDTPHVKPTADTTYTVNVNNVRINGAAQNFSYNVTVFDPDVAGNDYTPVTVSGTATPNIGSNNPYTVAKPAFASSFEWRTVSLSAYTKTYTAEGGLDGITTSTSSGYNVVQSNVVGADSATFHLAHPARTDQRLALPDRFYVGSNTSITFLSRLGYASSIQVARVQISLDGGSGWSDVYTQVGTDGSGESSFTTRTISLAAFASRTVRVRFNYTVDVAGAAYPQSDPGVGWYIDNIAVTNVQLATVSTSTPVASGTSFTFSPTSLDAIGLQARGLMFDTYGLEWGPVANVTPSPDVGSPDSRLINLSVLRDGGDPVTMGFVIRGTGAKTMLLRGVGPGLVGVGVPANSVLPDPALELYEKSTRLDFNEDWGGTQALRDAFASVGAFGLPDTSKDAAVVRALVSDDYSAKITGKAGTSGLTIVEAYDADVGNTAIRLVNLSALANVTNSKPLTAGFVIRNGRKKVLIRGVGPSLAVVGVTSGYLNDPHLTLYKGQTAIQNNEDWGGTATLKAAFSATGAFGYAADASKDAAIVVTLDPGDYSVTLAANAGDSGLAIVEIYEVQ